MTVAHMELFSTSLAPIEVFRRHLAFSRQFPCMQEPDIIYFYIYLGSIRNSYSSIPSICERTCLCSRPDGITVGKDPWKILHEVRAFSSWFPALHTPCHSGSWVKGYILLSPFWGIVSYIRNIILLGSTPPKKTTHIFWQHSVHQKPSKVEGFRV